MLVARLAMFAYWMWKCVFRIIHNGVISFRCEAYFAFILPMSFLLCVFPCIIFFLPLRIGFLGLRLGHNPILCFCCTTIMSMLRLGVERCDSLINIPNVWKKKKLIAILHNIHRQRVAHWINVLVQYCSTHRYTVSTCKYYISQCRLSRTDG